MWCEYNSCSTKEAKLVKAMDKLETIVQHNQGNNPEDFDYELSKNIYDLWCEYNSCSTKEAKLVKAMDKLETIVQHNQGNNPEDFDYEFNLQYGKKYFEYDDTLKYMRNIIDEDTKTRMYSKKFR